MELLKIDIFNHDAHSNHPTVIVNGHMTIT